MICIHTPRIVPNLLGCEFKILKFIKYYAYNYAVHTLQSDLLQIMKYAPKIFFYN